MPIAQTYEAKLYAPLFFASREGHLVEADRYISSTALSHAIGYKYGNLEKPYVLTGDEAVSPSYDHLRQLSFFVSDAEPLNVSISERTFRSTTYTSERNVISTDEEIAELFGNSKGVPQKAGKSQAGWHKVREYVGAEPGSKYQFTVFSENEELPEKLRFRLGIGRTGEIIAEQVEKADTVAVNKFLLERVHEIDEEQLMEVLKKSDEYRKGNDPRLHRFVGVDTDYFEERFLPELDSE